MTAWRVFHRSAHGAYHALAIGAALAFPFAVRAETLGDAWRMALETDSAMAAARSERDAADSDRSAATRLRFPVLDVTGSYTEFRSAPNLAIDTPAGRLEAPIWRHDTYAMAGADVSVPLWSSGRIGGVIGAATARADGASAKETQSAADVRLAVAEAYVGVLRARRALDVADSAETSLQAHADDVQVMYDKEAIPQSDRLAARVALANARQQRLRAANALRLATASYNRRVGQPLDRPLDLEPPVVPASSAAGEGIEQLISRAQQHRPELAALALLARSYQQAARAERAEALPQIVLHAGYNHLDTQILDRQNFASVGIGFQWRLFDGGQVAARTAALRHRERAAEQQLAEWRSLVALDVETAALDREEAAARIEVTAQAVAEAEENLRISRELYRSGLGTNTQVLDAESLRATALTNRDNAMFDLLVAEYRVERAIGEL